MVIWIYFIIATAFFIHFKDYLFFICDLTHRNLIWNTDEDNFLDFDEMDRYLKENYNMLDQITFKILFIFFMPIFLPYVIFYIKNKL